jgi:hypothetical protein
VLYQLSYLARPRKGSARPLGAVLRAVLRATPRAGASGRRADPQAAAGSGVPGLAFVAADALDRLEA